jgi:hypothetical protein
MTLINEIEAFQLKDKTQTSKDFSQLFFLLYRALKARTKHKKPFN